VRIETVYTFDSDEPMPLQQGRILDIGSFIVMYATVEETGVEEKAPAKSIHPGYAAYRRVKGGSFRESDVYDMADWVEALAVRADAKLAELREERMTRIDAPTIKAYDGLILGTQETISRARRNVSEFVEAFEELAKQGTLTASP
jgi:hypothetical protein